jgi:HD superfamily phosphohydrolase
LAGLLHDVGHCFFSHASEKMLGYYLSDMIEQSGIGEPKPHEYLTYLIVKSGYFQEYWRKNIAPIFEMHHHLEIPLIDDIADIIVGKPPSEECRFLQEIINGPYDVDKLEYLFRDARTAGLEISYDIERYFYKISIANKPEGTWRLVMDEGGVRAVEQIIFSKMMLYSFVYHHQKVLSSDLLVTDMLMELLNNDPKGDIKIEHPIDMLRYSDIDILSTINKGPSDRFNTSRSKLTNRTLPKRCFVINKEFVENIETDGIVKRNWKNLKKKLRGLPEEIDEVRNDIVKIMKEKDSSKDFTIDDIYISFPKSPTIEEPTSAPVLDTKGELTAMEDYYNLEGWQKTYDLKKLRGYFYSTPESIEIASVAVEKYLKEKFGLSFKDKAKIEAKITTNVCE